VPTLLAQLKSKETDRSEALTIHGKAKELNKSSRETKSKFENKIRTGLLSERAGSVNLICEFYLEIIPLTEEVAGALSMISSLLENLCRNHCSLRASKSAVPLLLPASKL
jgi:hypothetical protein